MREVSHLKLSILLNQNKAMQSSCMHVLQEVKGLETHPLTSKEGFLRDWIPAPLCGLFLLVFIAGRSVSGVVVLSFIQIGWKVVQAAVM